MPETKPKTKLTAKETAAIEYYTEPSSETRNNWSKSYLRAGYSKCKGWERNAATVHSKNHVKAAIKEIRANIGQKISVTREYCIEKLVNIVENSKNEANITRAIVAIGDFAGYHREHAPNLEKQQQRAAMLETELAELERLCRERTRALSGSQLPSSLLGPSVKAVVAVKECLQARGQEIMGDEVVRIVDNSVIDAKPLSEPINEDKGRA